MNDRVFIDTYIVTYAHVSNESEKNGIASALLKDKLADARIWISTQILSEFYSSMTKNKHEHDNIVEYIHAITERANVIPVSLATVESALRIKEKYQFSYWDSLMLSAALESRCEVVYTEDLQHNQVIESKLTILNPFL